MSAVLPIRHTWERLSILGPIGPIDILVDFPDRAPIGIVLTAHSHPLLKGSAEDQVTHAIAMALRDLGYISLRPFFRGTGATVGIHDKGEGEAEDLLAVHDYAMQRFAGLSMVLAGFSFGAFVQSKVAKRLAQVGNAASRLILVSTALGNVRNLRFYATEDVASNSLLIHGELDNRVLLETIAQWAGRQDIPVIAISDADHFFNGKLDTLREVIQKHSYRQADSSSIGDFLLSDLVIERE